MTRASSHPREAAAVQRAYQAKAALQSEYLVMRQVYETNPVMEVLLKAVDSLSECISVLEFRDA